MPDSKAIVLDDRRQDRLGFDEAILCTQKTTEQITEIVKMSLTGPGRRLFTRLGQDKFSSLATEIQQQLRYHSQSNTAVLGPSLNIDKPVNIGIVSAGSSDAPVVAEAQATLAYYGEPSRLLTDVGVAGIWRLMEQVDDLKSLPIVITVAGMDAALPSVLGGLVPGVIIGVPTATGYGAARQGETALSAMLCSCAPGLTVVNIDNGYGAACAALRMLKAFARIQM